MYDPRDEQRSFDAFHVDKDWASPSSGIAALPSPEQAGVPEDGRAEKGFVCVVGAGIEAHASASSGKLIAVDPELIDAATGWDLILVEADGARHLPLKAPADHEPVLPASSQVVIAVIGLDCLGKPLDESIAFRPELVTRATGLASGGILESRHLIALALAKEGCFKGAPTGAARVIVLNKLDAVDQDIAKALARAVLASGAADLVALTTLREEDPCQKMALLLKRT